MIRRGNSNRRIMRRYGVVSRDQVMVFGLRVVSMGLLEFGVVSRW